MDYNDQMVELRIRAGGGAAPNAQDVATFIYDLNLLYELLVLDEEPGGASVLASSTNFIYARNQRSIPSALKMRVNSMELGSPLDLNLGIPLAGVGAAAALALAKAIKIIYNLPADHRRALAEARLAEISATRAEREENQLAIEDFERRDERRAQPGAHPRGAGPASAGDGPRKALPDPIHNTERRLSKSRLAVTALEIRLPPQP